MAPKIDPGGIFFASGGAVPKQPEGPQGKEKKATTGPLSLPGCPGVDSRSPEGVRRGGPEGEFYR